jgi:hypothetical protein
MARATVLRTVVYAGTGLIILVAALIPLALIPRMAVHPEILAQGAVRTRWIFFLIQLLAAASLFAFFLRNRKGGWKDKPLLVVAGILVLLTSYEWLEGGSFYYDRFPNIGILNFLCAGANLIAGFLLIGVRIELTRKPSAG